MKERGSRKIFMDLEKQPRSGVSGTLAKRKGRVKTPGGRNPSMFVLLRFVNPRGGKERRKIRVKRRK